MTGNILYKSSVRHDLRKIDPKNLRRILREVRGILGNNPHAGEALHGEFKGLHKLHVGDYRVIYAIINEGALVLRITCLFLSHTSSLKEAEGEVELCGRSNQFAGQGVEGVVVLA